jgi:light-regulated signal transduction histidine kinase (bacteriophytochrome)
LEKLSDDGKIYLKKIVDASQRMQVMINDLLSISMISGDRAFTQYSLQAILEEVLQTLEYKIEQKNARIEADTLPEARIVPSQFRQLFQNLISNSLKFVREEVQPHIAIRCNYVSGEEVEHLDNAPQYLKLEFKDNGIGFEEEYAGKIFAIFPAAARPQRIRRHRHRAGHLQKDRGAPRRHHLRQCHPGTRRHIHDSFTGKAGAGHGVLKKFVLSLP